MNIVASAIRSTDDLWQVAVVLRRNGARPCVIRLTEELESALVANRRLAVVLSNLTRTEPEARGWLEEATTNQRRLVDLLERVERLTG